MPSKEVPSPSSKEPVAKVDTAFLNDQRVSWVSSKVEQLLFPAKKFKEAVSRSVHVGGVSVSGVALLKEFIEEGAAGSTIYFYVVDHAAEAAAI